MNSSRRQVMQWPLVLVPFVLVLTLGGCGYKDKPVPPQQIVPKAVTDLDYQLDEKGVTLFWGYPRETVTGNDVTDIAGFDLYRAVVSVDSYCETCPIPFASPISLPGGSMPPQGGRTATYQATVLRPGNLYFYKVRSRTGWWGQSQDSNIVSFLWQTPPMAPEGVTVVAGDGKITLRWQPVSSHQDTTPMTVPVQYQVYRSVDGGTLDKVGELTAATAYTDTLVENGRSYSYQVQAINSYDQGSVSSGMSAAVDANPMDRTAPPTPAEVQSILTDVGIKIFWNRVDSRDLAGYRVYRRSAAEEKAVMVGTVLVPYTIFIDTKAPKNVELYYSVSSIDGRRPANESAKSPEVTVIH